MDYLQPGDILETTVVGDQAHSPASRCACQPSIIFTQAAPDGGQLALNAAGLPSHLFGYERKADLLQYSVHFGRTGQTFGDLLPGDHGDTQFVRSMRRNEDMGRTSPALAPFINMIEPEGGVGEHG